MAYQLNKTGAQIDAIHTKVDGIEANATADQSDAEIETAYNNQVAAVSQAQAEAGTSTTVLRWTPQRVKQAIDALASGGASALADLSDVDSTVSSPSDGDILVYRSAGSDWVLEAKPAAGSNPAAADITDATADGIALITSADANPFTDADESKLDGIEANADATDTANVTSAGALMDSEVTNLAQVKAFDSSDYATAVQGGLADSAVQPGDNISGLTNDAGYITATLTQEQVEDFVGGMLTGNTETLITVTYQDVDGTIDFVVDNNLANYDNTTSGFITGYTVTEGDVTAHEAALAITASQVTDFDTEVSNNASVAANTAKTGVTDQISNVVEDTTPQLGGDLDAQDNNITSVSNIGLDTLTPDSTSGGLQLRNNAGTAVITVAAGGSSNTNITLNGATSFGSNNVTNIADIEVEGHSYADGEVDDGNSSTADTIDWGTGNFHKSTMTGNCTYTFTAPDGPTTMVLKLVQDATGSRTATWPATVKWPGGTAPTLSTAANSVDIITFYYDGTDYHGTSVLDLS